MATEMKFNPIGVTLDLNAQIAQRDQLRKKWGREFQENYPKVADAIACEIFQQVLTNISTHLTPYTRIPTEKEPISKVFSLDIGSSSTVETVKKWAGNTGQLAPFKEWFEGLGQQKEENIDKNNHFASYVAEEDAIIPYSISSSISSSSLKKVADYTDKEYFREQFSPLGRKIEELLRSKLEEISQLPQNENLKSTVEWYRKADKGILAQASSYKDNSLYVKVWVKEQYPEPRVQQPMQPPSSTGWSCTIL